LRTLLTTLGKLSPLFIKISRDFKTGIRLAQIILVLKLNKIMRYLLYAVILGVIALVLSPGSAVWRKNEPSKVPGEIIKAPPVTTRTVKIESKTEPVITANPPEPKIGPSPPASVEKLMIPVSGVGPAQLRDTYSDARSEGRIHNAIDIMAARGTPVLAASDGVIRKFFYSERGGNTIYQFNPDGTMVFYYAHLESYANGLTEGKQVKRGEVIAYVGDTGNAGAGNYHLHFALWTITDPKRFHHGENINPYPLLR
jgi:murein DD-endopeptidase MepM/ murein hydrolase activator NlpD